MDNLLNKKLGQYDIIETIGKGGQGIVYKAFDTEFSRNVAIKVFEAAEGTRRQKLARFKYEAHLAAALDHPNICTMYALLEDDDHTYMVMEYVEGKNLFELAYKRPLSVESVLRIAIQIADALSAAHERGIIHRDIKPRNVMVTDNGQALLLDFGLAKLMESDESGSIDGSEVLTKVDFFTDIDEEPFVTQEGVAVGTPASSPPEMALGLASDQRSDIFSFGVLLYLLLTGEYPFVARTKDEVRNKIINDDPVPISLARNSVENAPAELIAIVDRSLQKDPDNRFRSISEMLEGLKKTLASKTGASQNTADGRAFVIDPFRPAYAKPKTSWKNTFLIILLLSILILAAAGILTMFLH